MNAKKREETIANLEAERQLLGYLMDNNEGYWQIAKILNAKDFHSPIHEQLFGLIGSLITSNQIANPVTLQSYFKGQINYAPPVRYFLALVLDKATTISAEEYARTIANLSLRRKVIAGSQALIAQSETVEVTTPIEEILQTADLLFSDIRLSIPGSLQDTTSIAAVCDQSIEELAALIANSASPFPTIGLKSVTRHIGPLTPGCVYVIAGRPGSGKTAAAVAAARSIIRQRDLQECNFGVAFFTLEVTKRDIWNRFIACEMAQSATPVHYMNLKRGHITKVQYQAVERYSEALKRFPLSIDDKAGLTVAEIFIRARAEKQRLKKLGNRLSVVVVDYLQIIKPSGLYTGNKVAEISDISTALVRLAKDLNVAVIAVSQLSRKVEERADKRPIMADLRESGQIEQDANSIIFLFRPAYYDNQLTQFATAEEIEEFQKRENDLHYIIAKARDGIPGEVIAQTEIGKNHIYE